METILTTLDNGILTVTINRPDKLNALNRTVLAELDEVISDIYKDPGIHGVILTGSGPKAFVAGADISEFLSLSPEKGAAVAKLGQDIFFVWKILPSRSLRRSMVLRWAAVVNWP